MGEALSQVGHEADNAKPFRLTGCFFTRHAFGNYLTRVCFQWFGFMFPSVFPVRVFIVWADARLLF